MRVDPDERRRAIADTTAEIIAREGLDAATIRRIAAEFGGPTKVITYYFAEKQELLHFTWRHLADEYVEQVNAVAPSDIVGRLMAMAASDAKSVTRWRVYSTFWDRAGRDAVFLDLQLKHMDQALQLIADTLRAAGVERNDIDRISLLLNAIVQGISVQAIADQELWSSEQIRAALTDQVEALIVRRLPT